MKIRLLILICLTMGSSQAATRKPKQPTSTAAHPKTPPSPALPSYSKVFTDDPGQDGKFSVFSKDIKIPASKGQDATLYAPSLDAGRSMVNTGRYPLIILLPGKRASYSFYEPMMKNFVSWGFIVLGIDFISSTNHVNLARQVQETIDWTLSPANPALGILDPDKIAVAGHSLGGKIAFYAASGDDNRKYPEINFQGDPRIKIIIAWDPVDGGPPCPIAKGDAPGQCLGYAVLPTNMQRIKAKVLVFGGMTASPNAMTCTPAGRTHADFYAHAKSDSLHVDFPRSGHADWINQKKMFGLLPKVGNLLCGDNPTADPIRVQALARRTQIAWLLKYFENYSGLDRYLTGSILRNDCEKNSLCRIEYKNLAQ